MYALRKATLGDPETDDGFALVEKCNNNRKGLRILECWGLFCSDLVSTPSGIVITTLYRKIQKSLNSKTLNYNKSRDVGRAAIRG